MGFITSNKMVPLILLKILWTEAEKDHPISLKRLCMELLEIYEPKGSYKGRNFEKKVVRVIQELNEAFEEIDAYKVDGFHLRIEVVKIKSTEYSSVHYNAYYLSGRLFSDSEIRLLSDGVLYSPGIERKQADFLYQKLCQLSSKYFSTAFEYVKYSDIVKRTNNEEVFESIGVIAKAIREKKKISFLYNGNFQETVVSPYYLVICIGRYYLLCNKDNKEEMSHYRLDRIHSISLLNDSRRDLSVLTNLDDAEFDVERYVRQRPRMTTGKLVRVLLQVQQEYLSAVEMEFYTESIVRLEDGTYRVRIRSTKTAICNWIVNMTGKVVIENDYGAGVIEQLCQNALEILAEYQSSKESV